MARLVWDSPTDRRYEDGLSRGVLYPSATDGVVWNGLVSVNETKEDPTREEFFIDGVKYSELIGSTSFRATIKAFSAPVEFGPCVGNLEIWPGFTLTRQRAHRFDLSYRTYISGDEGYRLHLVYQALAIPTAKSSVTLDDKPQPDLLEWNVLTKPVDYAGRAPTSHISIDSTKVDPAFLLALETILYGIVDADPRIVYPTELIDIYTV